MPSLYFFRDEKVPKNPFWGGRFFKVADCVGLLFYPAQQIQSGSVLGRGGGRLMGCHKKAYFSRKDLNKGLFIGLLKCDILNISIVGEVDYYASNIV